MLFKRMLIFLMFMNYAYAAEQKTTIIGLFEHQGNRPQQEDRWLYDFVISDDQTINGGHLLGVLDGFNGSQVADNAVSILPLFFKNSSGTIEEKFKKSFANFDETLAEDFNKECGATATLVFIKDRVIHYAQLGSPRAVSIKKEEKLEIDFTTKEHVPNDLEEKARIEKLGGHIQQYGKAWRVEGYLTSSRAFGCSFADMKKYIIPEPTYTCKRIAENSQYLVLATDGLWTEKSNDAVLEIIEYAQMQCGAIVDAHKLVWVLGQKSVHARTENMTILMINLLLLAQSKCPQKVAKLKVDINL